jgi:hypothetical protein
MGKIGPLVLVIGVISMVIGVILRFLAKETALGLAPSSFLEFSIACFLLNIALKK